MSHPERKASAQCPGGRHACRGEPAVHQEDAAEGRSAGPEGRPDVGAGIGRSDKVVGVQGRVRPPAAPLWKVAVPAVRTGRVRQDAARGVAGASVNTDVALAEIRRGRPPRAAVLFAGAGGMTLGLYTAGCEIVAAVEIDPVARLTHEVNFAHRSLFYRSFEDVTRTHQRDLPAAPAEGRVGSRPPPPGGPGHEGGDPVQPPRPGRLDPAAARRQGVEAVIDPTAKAGGLS